MRNYGQYTLPKAHAAFIARKPIITKSWLNQQLLPSRYKIRQSGERER